TPDQTWTDHTDLRPTMLSLVGLKDDYTHDGRLLNGDLTGYAVPAAVKKSGSNFTQLADAYKQLNASFGTFAMNTLKASTRALASTVRAAAPSSERSERGEMRRLAVLVAATFALALGVSSATASGQDRSNLKNYQHVWVIMMENTGYDSLIGNPNAPWINEAA